MEEKPHASGPDTRLVVTDDRALRDGRDEAILGEGRPLADGLHADEPRHRVDDAERVGAYLEVGDDAAERRVEEDHLLWLEPREVESGLDRVEVGGRAQQALRHLATTRVERDLELLLPRAVLLLDD